MVPPNWEHPKKEVVKWPQGIMEERYQPMFDEPFAKAMTEWYERWQAWERGERPDYCTDESKDMAFWDWDGGPPDPAYHRPDWPAGTATWFQVYETVSEGTPVTPPFATKEELVEYLVANGDFWDQSRRARGITDMGCGPWSRKAAESFVFGSGWAPSFISHGGQLSSGVEALAQMGGGNSDPA